MTKPQIAQWLGYAGFFVGIAALPVEAQETRLALGHYDLALNYTVAEGWDAYIFDHGTGERLKPVLTVFQLEADPDTVPAGQVYAPLGAPGDPVWILPEVYDAERIYLGIGAPLLGRNIFTGGLSNRGEVTMRLLRVEGSGPDAGGSVSLWQSGFPPQFFFSSSNGLGPEDALVGITANFHAHYNFGFTAPGLYRLTFALGGELRPEHGGGMTQTEVTYTFEVGGPVDTSPLRYAWPVSNGWEWSTWMGWVYRAAAPWIYNYDHGWLYLAPGDPEGFWVYHPTRGWCWSQQGIYAWLWSDADQEWFAS